ncbi:aminotransferase class V-fold PLP-dependent enzyme [Niabella beijingensis]|uniref:aminotransferase class V-fold PLP-dependent enzyme n=1 Tax=Niabella beijingensis TaxID=2872700 RepID=UPI001CBF2750|nr:aminotransferase class V-fold PLP-dependent enzyme [Niabella beijingensis]MBZ4189257.1 aminotransferase class V-fold PLP-dependent enzyme [Niabella beijingensis]
MAEATSSIYFNTAACGLIPETVLQAGTTLYKNFEHNSSAASELWRDVEAAVIRKNTAAFIGAGMEHIAFVPNFSFGMNAVVHALKGDEKVLLYRKDFPSVYIPFLINKFDIVWLDDEDGFFIDIEKIKDLIRKEGIRLVAISHVQWQTGFKIDLKTLCDSCRSLGTRTIIDATQSMGAVHISLSEIQPDVCISSNYKWMNAGFGTGILYMRPDFAAEYPPKVSGAHSNAYQYSGNTFSSNNSVLNYEPGGLNMYGLTILNRAIEIKQERGLAAIEAHNTALARLLLPELPSCGLDLLGPPDTTNRSSIIVINDAEGLHDHLSQNNIITTRRNGRIRISLHYHNTEAEVSRFIASIRDWRK